MRYESTVARRRAPKATSAGFKIGGSRDIARVAAESAMISALVGVMVLGIPLPASAAIHTYWTGETARNVVKTSATVSMNGGSTALNALSGWIRTRATVYDLGSFESSAPGGTYSHARVTARVYCQWRVDLNIPNPIPTGTKYHLTCKYNY